MRLKDITFENSGVDVFWDKYINKSAFILPMHAEKWYIVRKDKNWDTILKKVDVFVADGVGLKWGYLLLTNKRLARVSGVDLIDALIEKHPNVPTYLWGATEENIVKAYNAYKKRGLNVVGYHNGYDDDDDKIISSIKKSGAKICFVGNDAKRAADLAIRVHEKLGITTMTAGGSFDVAAGDYKRAPKLVQKIGLEWLWRMVIEPKRFKRIPALFGFVWYVLKEKVRY